jgi:hypothetical protein
LSKIKEENLKLVNERIQLYQDNKEFQYKNSKLQKKMILMEANLQKLTGTSFQLETSSMSKPLTPLKRKFPNDQRNQTSNQSNSRKGNISKSPITNKTNNSNLNVSDRPTDPNKNFNNMKRSITEKSSARDLGQNNAKTPNGDMRCFQDLNKKLSSILNKLDINNLPNCEISPSRNFQRDDSQGNLSNLAMPTKDNYLSNATSGNNSQDFIKFNGGTTNCSSEVMIPIISTDPKKSYAQSCRRDFPEKKYQEEDLLSTLEIRADTFLSQFRDKEMKLKILENKLGILETEKHTMRQKIDLLNEQISHRNSISDRKLTKKFQTIILDDPPSPSNPHPTRPATGKNINNLKKKLLSHDSPINSLQKSDFSAYQNIARGSANRPVEIYPHSLVDNTRHREAQFNSTFNEIKMKVE